MEGLINVIKDLQGVIQRGLSNFKKSPKDRLCIEYIETKQDLLERDWNLFKDNYTKIQEQFKVHESSKLVDLYDSTEDTYITYKCLIKSMLKKYGSSKDVTQVSNNSSSASQSNYLVKLPKIGIPTFSGKYAEWTTFRDLFVSLVHNNVNLDNVQKMHYLKSHLSGEAEQLVRHTPVTASNYEQCWSQLEKRYNNKKYLVNCILKRLFGQKRMHVESAASLKDLLDTTNDCLSALSNLDVNVTTWDVIIIHIVTFKLDAETRKQWELYISSNESNDLPTFKQFSTFIENRFRALECLEPKRVSAQQVTGSHTPKSMVTVTSNNMRCEYCSEGHKLCFCKSFAKQSVLNRRDFVLKNNICFNCLGSNHTVTNCQKQATCRTCSKRHHSLLHLSATVNKGHDNSNKQSVVEPSSNSSSNDSPVVSCFSKTLRIPRQVLLATALVKAESKTGDYHIVRALIDQGSQACLISEATVQYLRLSKIPVHGIVSGLNQQTSLARYMVKFRIQSRVDKTIELNINAYVLDKITSHLPEQSINKDAFDWINIQTTHLADPKFYQPSRIDILLGAEVYSCILKEAMLRNPSRTLIAQNTTLGWIISGAVNNRSTEAQTCINVMHTQFREDELLKKFWEVEEQQPSLKKIRTPEELRCEELYETTTTRREDGRYVVKLPFKNQDPLCKAGGSRTIAESRFKSLEKRLQKNVELKERYAEGINEYLQLGHMRPVKYNDDKKDIAVYLPHHAVIREDKTTTKVRVVFNASEKNKKGVSLNDTLMIGPTLQADLRQIVLKWRVYPIGIVADIEKMYRQVFIAEEDAMFQRILWRDDPAKEIRDYELLTVTFGTASAPYQAVRTLHQVIYDEGENYPMAADKGLNSFYMDDLMAGCSNVDEGIQLYKQITELLLKGGFLLQKWNSNSQELLNKIHAVKVRGVEGMKSSEEEITRHRSMVKEPNEEGIDIKIDSTMKILGLTWNRSKDCFQYTINLPPMATAPVTKRAIISDIARLFDPLGWLAPSVVVAKIFIQRLWVTGIGWDEPLANEIVSEWTAYREELLRLTQVQIPRWYSTKPGDDIQLHGFCDASKSAYAAVVYLRKIDIAGNVSVSLVAAKSRVAPIKQISIPRLELSGAVLLARLLTEIAGVLDIPRDKVKAWTDSTIVLAWLGCHPSKWKTFVANRTSEILTSMHSSQWFHVSTKDSPADCASRGVSPKLLVDTNIWFLGPQFLKERIVQYHRPKDLQVTLEQSIRTHVATLPDDSDLFERFSSLKRLIRVIAYCRRFMNVRTHKETYLQNKETEDALECCIRRAQRQAFTDELIDMQNKGNVSSKSKLKSLCPYLDSKGIMRVRGRLEKAPLDERMKHPIILPNSTHFTHLVVLDAHHKTMHGGPQLMTNYLRTAYWIIGVRNLVKRCVRSCVICARQRAKVANPMMGSLPSVRCVPARPFLHSGVDYAGPINIRTTKGRGYRSYKGYICVFVCMVTRAIHLEVVSDMSSQAFLAAFRRFTSRRGHCAKLFSDNGTTFVGAARELRELVTLQSSMAEQLEANGTEWHFIPPHAPNFGGLWEAGVKSIKYHLKRVIGDSTLTFEELSTLLCQIEACLNSRPISTVNLDDPAEPMPLTPGHFLIGEPMVAVHDYDYESSNLSSLTRWQLVQRNLQSFWRRWSHEYLSNLMNRYKWSYKSPEPNVGDIVLIKEDDLPPSRWLLGRIVEKHPGYDNVTRVVTLRTKSSTIKRPVNKLCVLPVAT